MPVSFLSATQRERYDRYPDSLSADELARYFHLDDDDREWIATGNRAQCSRHNDHKAISFAFGGW
ncbi:MAG: DUF4158 domain-containing protein [Betaproteobacteria bacterium]|nr:DUF4158 domain-containing protein [Betaproteobacteria bacterium]